MSARSLKTIIVIYSIVVILGSLSLAILTKRDSFLTEAYKVAVDKITKQEEGLVSYDSGYLSSLLVNIDNNESLITLLLLLHIISASLLLFLILNIKLNKEEPNNAA